MRKLDFLIAGTQKGGTTALHNYLKQNPDVFLSERKELHFFDNETIDWQNPPYEKYHDAFKTASSRQKIGEATPIYTFWPDALARISKYNKDIKLIICLRNPTERAYSHWRMETSRQEEYLPFNLAIRHGRKRIIDEASRRTYTYVERGFYADQIQQAIDLFHKENIHIIMQETLLNAHNVVLEKICDFLKVPHIKLAHDFIRPIKNDDTLPLMSKTDRDYLDALYKNDQIRTNEILNGINKLK